MREGLVNRLERLLLEGHFGYPLHDWAFVFVVHPRGSQAQNVVLARILYHHQVEREEVVGGAHALGCPNYVRRSGVGYAKSKHRLAREGPRAVLLEEFAVRIGES